MSYTKRIDGRKMDETRPIIAKVGIIPNAKGSASFTIGKTTAYAAVYGPRELHPKFLQDPKTGKLRCNYNMMPFSGSGERIRPGPSRRSKEISMVTQNALASVMDLSDYPNTVVDVFIEIPQADAGTRCAGICAASMALADAGFKMKDMPVAIAIGVADNKTVFADPDYAEETLNQSGHAEHVADIAMTLLPRAGKITHLQMDGMVSKEKLFEAVEIAKKVVKKINDIMRTALKEQFNNVEASK
ncbi:exosome complex exonuclease Rrp41 [Candidatus Woesearchaeota archaeon]|nr:exosome complex exonuclease Rrp41 [Candidatus Woesearchaeota archaeon]MBW3014644.1 exosome complex exonuclease Rrp41 [Candidatus Woesearchaeota archaeon]